MVADQLTLVCETTTGVGATEKSYYFYAHLGGTALGAGANVLDRKIGASCSSPVEVATQQTFSILMPIMKGPPRGPGCHYKVPNTTV